MEALPGETWMNVFESLDRPADIQNVMLSCRAFCSLSRRLIWRYIHWKNPVHLAKCLTVLEGHPEIKDVPTSLVVSVSAMDKSFHRLDASAAIIEQDGRETLHSTTETTTARLTATPCTFYASIELYRAMAIRISTFEMLEELTFHDTTISRLAYDIIGSLPRLRRLSLNKCKISNHMVSHGSPTSQDQPDTESPNFISLPITDLRLIAIAGVNPGHDWFHIYSLTMARNLRALKMDWNSVSSKFLGYIDFESEIDDSDEPEDQNLMNLVRFEACMPIEMDWKVYERETERRLISRLIQLLTRCSAIVNLTITEHLPSFPLPPHALPHLRSYTGPLCGVVAATMGRPVVDISINEGVKKDMPELIQTLPLLAENRTSLESLSLNLAIWDDEILYIIVDRFQHLKRLRLCYSAGAPTEYMLLSLGPHFLCRLPDLTTIHVYNPYTDELVVSPAVPPLDALDPLPIDEMTLNERPTLEVNEEFREIIISWRRWCKNLREVRFSRQFVWRRSHDGDEWAQRVV